MDIPLSGIEASSFTENGDEDQSYSAAQVLEKLERAWMNEKMCPELLEHHMEFVDVMLEQLKELEVMISQTTVKNDIRVSTHLMEMDRIKYIISDYLRCRIKKIEEYAQFIATDPIEQTKLTDHELSFATSYWASVKAHLDDSAGSHMPENVRKINMDKMVIKPDYYSYVFLSADKPVTGVTVTEPGTVDEEIIDFDTNDQYLLPYKAVDNIVNNASAHLI